VPMIDIYAATGTFPDTHKLAVDATYAGGGAELACITDRKARAGPLLAQPVSKLPGAQRPQKGPDHRRKTIRLVIGKPMACVL
jgi:hypothetical protein